MGRDPCRACAGVGKITSASTKVDTTYNPPRPIVTETQICYLCLGTGSQDVPSGPGPGGGGGGAGNGGSSAGLEDDDTSTGARLIAAAVSVVVFYFAVISPLSVWFVLGLTAAVAVGVYIIFVTRLASISNGLMMTVWIINGIIRLALKAALFALVAAGLLYFVYLLLAT